MEFRILGPLEVAEGSRPIPVAGVRQGALLALLLLHGNEMVSSDRLLEELWGGEPSKRSHNALQQAVSRLRRGLGRERLVTRPPGYLLRLEPDELDTERFERLLAEGRAALQAGEASRAAETLREALALFRDEPLSDFRYEPFAQGEIARLEELRQEALEERIDADLALGRHAAVVGELEPLVAANPLREHLTGQLMLALYRSGRQADALEWYRRARGRLVEELALEPGPELRELEAAILRQDASLSLPVPARRLAGPAVVRAEPVHEVRKTVTVLFADLADSTGLADRLDPEALRKVLARHFELGSDAIRRHGGAVEKYIGDAVMAVFGVPELHEDDALRALRAASELRDGTSALNEELAHDFGVRLVVRIGINTGEVVAGDASAGEPLVTGEPVVTAARLEQAAAPGEILVGDATRRLVANAVRVEPLFPLDLKGKERPVSAWRLLELVPGAAPFARRLDAPLVGRGIELDQLETAFRRAVRERSLHLITVLGPPGIGKTRLAQEAVGKLAAEAQVLEGRCLAYGEGITFWPLRGLVLELTGQGDPRDRLFELLADDKDKAWIVERLLGAIGLNGGAAPTEEIFAAARKLLESLARRRPLLVVVEDIHWAEAAFLDLVEHLSDFTSDAPVLMLCLARPELVDEWPSWGGGKRNAALLELGSLTDDEAGELLETLGSSARVAEKRTSIKQAAEGNPLFLEQMVAWLAEDRPPESDQPLPPTIQAVLAARLERLGPGERAVLERAAIVGKEFRQDEVLELLPPEARPTAPRNLQGLVRKQFVRPAGSGGRVQETLRFRHILIRDAAYRGVPKELRAELHERFADWLEHESDERIAEIEEILGYHLERAHRYRKELAPSDPGADPLAQRAGERLAAAGSRAVTRGDVHAAASLLGRAASLLPRADRRRVALLPDLGESLAEAGRLEEGRAVLHEAVETGREVGNVAVEWRALAADGWWRLRIDRARPAEIEELARSAIRVLDEIGDESGLAKAWRLLGDVHHGRGEYVRTCEATERAFEHARRAGDRHEQFMSLAVLGVCMLWGATPADEGMRRLTDIREEVGDDPPLEAATLRPLGGFHVLKGHVHEGRRLVDRSRDILEELGFRWAIAAIPFVSGEIERLAGDLEAAESELRKGVDLWDEMGELGAEFTMLAALAEVLYEQGHCAEAEDAAGRVLAMGMPDLEQQAGGGAVRAKTLARRGQFEEAERVARETVALTEGTDSYLQRTRALLAMAEVLELAGRAGEAAAWLREALRLFEAKGDVISARRTRERVARLEAA